MNTTTPSTDAWEALHRAHVTITRQAQAHPEFRTITLREFDLLDVLSRVGDEGMRLKTLNEFLPLTQSSLSRMLERLERRGYVHRWTDPDDLRGLRIRLTPDGWELTAAVGARHRAHINDTIGTPLTDNELTTLTYLINKIRDHAQETK